MKLESKKVCYSGFAIAPWEGCHLETSVVFDLIPWDGAQWTLEIGMKQALVPKSWPMDVAHPQTGVTALKYTKDAQSNS